MGFRVERFAEPWSLTRVGGMRCLGSLSKVGFPVKPVRKARDRAGRLDMRGLGAGCH